MPNLVADCDLCVIGGGEAGFAAAIGGIGLGLNVALVDPGDSEPCWRNWEVALPVLRRVAGRGADGAQAGLAGFRAELRRALAAAAPDRRFARLAAMNVRVLRGLARFVGPEAVEVQGRIVRARRFVLATGPGTAEPGTRAHLLERLLGQEPIEHFVALEGDARAVALAQGLRRLGLSASVHAPAGVLPGIDPELVQGLRRAMLHEGIHLEEGRSRTDTPRHFEFGSLVYARSAGSVPPELGLEGAGIAVQDGRIVLSPSLRTTNRRVFAIGALAGARSSQASQAQVAVVLKAAFFRLPAQFDASKIPYCIETDPGIAVVGRSEPEARADGPVTICRWPLAETLAGAALGLEQGHVKIVAGRGGRVLGAGIVGSSASEQIAFWTAAIHKRMTLGQIAALPLPSASLSDASRRAAVLQVARNLQSPWLKRAMALLSRFG